MSAGLLEREATGDGGVTARRAVVRWAVRMFRREWRQQILVLALLGVAVVAAIGFASVAYNVAAVPGNAVFGTANHSLEFEGSDPQALKADVAAAKQWFGTIDVIGHRDVPIPGEFKPLDYRAQDSQGAYGGPTLALREGRYPTTAGQIAVTDAVAESFKLDLGDTFALDGTPRTVVGRVENPSDLNDEFALVSPSHDAAPESVTILVRTSPERIASFRPPGGASPSVGARAAGNEGVLATVGVLGVATVALLLVALLAAAGFVVIAQRRLRQLGMLAAIGATEKHLRLAMVANGVVVGVVAAVTGTAIALLGWIAVVPQLELAFAHRIDRSNVPWWLIATGMLLAVAAATGAAWWPARMVAQTPIVRALSGRPPRPRSVHRSAALAGLIIAAGVVCLAGAGAPATDTGVSWINVLLIGGGTVAIIVGVLLVSPLAIRGLAACAAPLPFAPRLALRDLARYQARSGAALAAVTLVLGIPMAIIFSASAAEYTADAGNLSDRQLMIRAANTTGPFIPRPAELERLQTQVDRVVATLDNPTLIALDVALDPALAPDPQFDGREAVFLSQRNKGGGQEGWRDLSPIYVATPKLLSNHGLDLDALDPDTGVLTGETGELRVAGSKNRSAPTAITRFDRRPASYTSLPGSFITLDALKQRGWQAAGSGRWLVETNQPLTTAQLATARGLAAGAGLTIESRDHQEGLATLRWQATAIGMLLALGVLAMTVGLIRSEAAGDLRTLTAAGATSATRRALTAATAGTLAALGVSLGTVGAFVALTAGYLDDLSSLSRVPVLHLVIIAVGTPTAAALAGWLLAGREPPSIARQPIE